MLWSHTLCWWVTHGHRLSPCCPRWLPSLGGMDHRPRAGGAGLSHQLEEAGKQVPGPQGTKVAGGRRTRQSLSLTGDQRPLKMALKRPFGLSTPRPPPMSPDATNSVLEELPAILL